MSIEQVFEAGGKLAASPLVIEVNFKKSDKPNLPGGLYLKPVVSYGNWGRPWKFDIWSLEQAMIDSNLATMHHFQSRMTRSLREQIILYKNTILNEQSRTPMLSGYHIYKAFIDEGLVDFAAVTRYLNEKGIQV